MARSGLSGREADGTASGSYQVVDFGIADVEPFDCATTVL